MTLTALEINDAGVLAVGADGIFLESPGFALLDERGIVVGRDARRRARLQPRLVNHRFWDQLSTDLIRTPARVSVSSAELVSLHLASIWRHVSRTTDQVILAVPGCYSTTQLGLLLGISQELGIPVGGVIDSGLAAATASGVLPGCYLDIQLHKVHVTTLSSPVESKPSRCNAIDEWGLVALYEHWQRVIRDEFIRTTRFDPLYSAQSEQALFDGLAPWLSDIETRSSIEVGLGGPDGRVHTIALAREQLVSAVLKRYAEIATLVDESSVGGERVIQLSHRLGGLPGVREALGNSSEDIRVLPLASAARGALEHADVILDNGATTFTDRLPGAQPGRDTANVTPTLPTHLLYGGRAYPLIPDARNALRLVNREKLAITHDDGSTSSHCVLGVTAQQVTVLEQAPAPLYLNGACITKPTRVNVGDTLKFEDNAAELKLIAVMDGHET
jgi:hypothetical protein